MATDACDLSIVGVVVPPEGDPFRGEVRITGGRIDSVAEGVSDAPAGERIDAGDAYVMPGGVDCHVHCLSEPGEGIEAGTRAAAAGGVTTIVEMPYDAAGPINSVERLEAKAAKLAEEAWVDVALLATARPNGGAADVAALVEAGAVGFKLSLFHTDPDRFPRIPDDQLLDVFAEIHKAGSQACVHAENDEVIKALIARYRSEGRTSPRDHCASRPPVSETEAVLRACELGRSTGVRLHLCHVSLPRSADIVGWFQAQGSDVTAETCPHYLVWTEDAMDERRSRLKINPPLRSEADREALWERLAATDGGPVHCVSSDHAPWPIGHKTKENVFDNHSGAPGVETLVPLVTAEALRRGVPITHIARLLATNPAGRYGLATKGALRAGLDGDVVVFDPSTPWTIDENALHSNAGWSPFDGLTLQGRVTLAVSRGEVVWDGSSLQGQPGRGQRVLSQPR